MSGVNVAAPTPPANNDETQRQSVQRLLPTCQRCRRLRRKCDTQLPSCRACEKAGAECTFYDHALKQALPRSYVNSLLARLERLEAFKNGGSSQSISIATLATAETATASAIQPSATPNDPQENNTTGGFTQAPLSDSFDVVIPSPSAVGRSRYWGSSSVFALMAELMQHAVTKGFVSQEDVAGEERDEQPEGEEDAYEFSTDPEQPSMCLNPPNEEDVRALIHLYFVSVNQLYGFVDRTETSVDLQTYLTLRRQPGFSTQTLHGQQAHHFFRITMICAISCANQARYRPQRTAECLAYYADAVACVEDVTSEVTAASLQALLLLIVFCLFNPRKGDIWKLLDHACRLTIELGYHTEETEPEQPRRTSLNTGGLGSGPEMTTAAAVGGVASTFPSESVQARNKLRRSTFWGLYAIERIVGQLFGRGSDLPETIITAEYPSSLYALHTGFSPLATVTGPSTGTNNGVSLGGVDQEALQSMSIAHHYRLVYLRSEIFRVMYLPASPPSLGLNWLKERHAMLYAWRRELAVSDDLEGVATLTCDVGYDCTMCFLFQPLLLKALRDTMAPEGSPGRGDRPAEGSPGARSDATGDDATGTGHPAMFVASDPFYSAINLIRTYEKIIRGPERSTLGTYPMTFLSAHYICIACSTLIAHALLRVDGRTKTLRRMSDGSSVVSEAETEELDWGAFLDVSGSCLILLAWCGERWPGMLSMLGVYQKFMTRMTRELIGLGLVT